MRTTLAIFTLGLAGCAQLAPDAVGQGVARLTIRDLGAVATLVNDDATCGFANPDVIASGVADDPLGLDTFTLTVDDCAIDLGEATEVAVDCNGVTTTGRGRVTVAATRTTEGVGSGADLVPVSPDAVTLSLTRVAFEDFEVTRSDSDESLRVVDGSVSATLVPRLAVAASSGACAIATPNVAFSNVRYEDAHVVVTSADGAAEVDVATSDITAQAGFGESAESSIAGTITVFGSTVDVAGDDGALDPSYDRAQFAASYACTPDLAAPDDFACVDVGD